MASVRRPPGPRDGLFGLTLWPEAQRTPLQFMEKLRREYGNLIYFRIGLQNIYLLFDADDVRSVLASHYDNFVKGRGIPRRGRLMGEGLLTGEGDYHRQQRRLLMPAFHRPNMQHHAEVMVSRAAEAADRWRDGQTIELFAELRRLTMSIASRALFGVDADDELDELMAGLRMFDDLEFRVFRLPFAHLRDKLPQARINAARRRFEKSIERLIAKRRAANTSHNGDLLSLLLAAQDSGSNRPLTDREVCDEVVTIALTTETAAVGLMWTLYALSQQPEVERRLHAELDEVIGGRLPSIDDLPNLHVTEMVLSESMRLYPPAWRLVRTALKNFDVGGYTIPANSLIVVSPYMVHRDPRYYPNPDTFDLDRWTPAARASRPGHAYVPFGGGPRRCIGENFALTENALLLAILAGRWRLRCAPGSVIRHRPAPLLRIRPDLRMVLERRQPAHSHMASAATTMAMDSCPFGQYELPH